MKRATAHLAAVMAGIALLLQAFPAPARASVVEVCTEHGIEQVLVPGDAPAMPGDCGHCGHCVLTAAADGPTSRLVLPVRYAVAPLALEDPATAPPAKARAPPRPLGQAPPVL